MSFETGVFPVLVSENESLESLSPQVREDSIRRLLHLFMFSCQI